MSAHDDVDRRLAEWLAGDAPRQAPTGLVPALRHRLDRTPQRRYRLSGWGQGTELRLVAVAAVLLLAAVSVGLLAGGGSRTETATPAPSPGGPEHGGPMRVVATVKGLTAGGLVSIDGRALLVGSTGADASQRGAAWSTIDGSVWTEVPSDASVPLITPVTGSPARVVAIGPICGTGATTPAACPGVGVATLGPKGLHWTAVAWRSDSPQYGTPVTTGPGATGYGFLISSVTANAQSYLMVGSAMKLAGTSVPSAVGPAIASSVDGATWRWRVLPNSTAGAEITAAAIGPGATVAVGAGPTQDPVVWISRDGSSWDQVPPADGPSTVELDAVTWGAAGFVAVGRSGANASVWLSGDGRAWRPAPQVATLAGAWMTGVVWTGSEYVATGTSGGDGAAWASADGSSWTRLDQGAAAPMPTIVAAGVVGSHLILIGQTGAGDAVVESR